MIETEEKLLEYVIPDNVLEQRRILGFRRRNWIEGLICVSFTCFVILQIPFVLRVKIIFLVCIGGPVLLLNLIGMKDQSLFELIKNFGDGMKNSGKYHLRRPNIEERSKSGMAKSLDGIGRGDSAADKVADFAKKKFRYFSKKG